MVIGHDLFILIGYNVVEVNASDDRSVQAFKTQLEAATRMKSVIIEENPRPNCLILDEIDGAPQVLAGLLLLPLAVNLSLPTSRL